MTRSGALRVFHIQHLKSRLQLHREIKTFHSHFLLKSCHTFTKNRLRNPLVSSTGSTQLMKVEAKTQMKEMTIHAVKKPREKM